MALLGAVAAQANAAVEFIDQIAAKSSTSGQACLIRFSNGHTESSAK